jgi:hypothetical protein
MSLPSKARISKRISGGDGFAADRDIAVHHALRRHNVTAANDQLERRSPTAPIVPDYTLGGGYRK